MVRGASNGKKKTAPKTNGWTTFVDVPLAGVEFAVIDGTFEREEDLYDSLTTLLESGYRVGFSYNPSNDATTCSLTCKDEGNPNEGKTLTSFGATWVDALKVALYKHFVITNQDWSSGKAQGGGARFG